MKEIQVDVRLSDGESSEFIECNTYTLYVDDNFDDSNYDKIFDCLFETFPEDFPKEDPGVNAEIIDVRS